MPNPPGGAWFDPVVRDDLLAGSIGDDAATVARLFAERYSCRAFKPDAVPRADVERLFVMAQSSASWCNAQPWQLIVTSGDGTERFRKALFEHAASRREAGLADFDFPKEYVGAYQTRRRETAQQLYESLGIAWGDREASRLQGLENYRFFDAPHVALITSDAKLGVYGAIDCGLYLGHLVIAAQSLGVATIVQAALAIYPRFIREHFGLGEDRLVVCGVSFGYADLDHPANAFRTRRASLEQVVRWIDT